MSVLVSAVPYALILGIAKVMAIGTATTIARAGVGQAIKNKQLEKEEQEYFANLVKHSLKNKKDIKSDDLVTIICQEYETVFCDAELLIKTIEEHGFEKVGQVHSSNVISYRMDDFKLDFYKDGGEQFKMKITCADNCDFDKVISNIDAGYTANVQEETYLKIKERLRQQNLEIDDEEILEDDSIVLTINLD